MLVAARNKPCTWQALATGSETKRAPHMTSNALPILWHQLILPPRGKLCKLPYSHNVIVQFRTYNLQGANRGPLSYLLEFIQRPSKCIITSWTVRFGLPRARRLHHINLMLYYSGKRKEGLEELSMLTACMPNH